MLVYLNMFNQIYFTLQIIQELNSLQKQKQTCRMEIENLKIIDNTHTHTVGLTI